MRCYRQFATATAITLWASLASASIAEPQDRSAPARAVRSAPVTPTTAPIVGDGRLDEPIWSSARTFGALAQRQPDTAQAPPESAGLTALKDSARLHTGL